MFPKERANEVHRLKEVVRTSVGAIIKERRGALCMTLQTLSDRAGCAKSYLSSIENERRATPPSDDLLSRIEAALDLPEGRLLDAAHWARTPERVRDHVARLHQDKRAAQQLAGILGADGIDEAGRVRGSLDDAYRSGALRRLVERVAGPDGDVVRTPLPVEIPLINKVAAGYPADFTDLGFPARVADEYVRAPDLDDPDAFAARVVGTSMLPEYREGDIVIFSPSRDVRNGNDCFARIEPDHESTFKRVYFERDGFGREMIRLQPLNSEFPPRVLFREQVAGLYPAVSVMRSVG
jgi:phage repressor protein C with HTH and peptisase S24 domain